MKKTLLIFVSLIFLLNSLLAQRRVEAIYESQSFQLNSGVRALVGGQSRSYLAIPIPEGAKAIVYAVVGYVNYDGKQNLKLAAQLTATLTGHVALASAIKMIDIPLSNAVMDIFALPDDNNNLSYFMNKIDARWVQYSNYSCVSALGCKMVIPVSSGMNSLYLGFRNPSSTNRIVITVDVAAVF